MTHKYAKLTKAELLLLVDQIETELTEAHAFTFEGKVEQFMTEVKLLGQDLVKLVQYVYNAGVRVRAELEGLSIMKHQ
jgi:hypothetical protein